MKRFRGIGSVFEQYWYVFLILGALASFALCMLMGLHQPVWFDEEYSIILAKHPVAQLLSLTGVDAHPPLYYLLLKAWGSIFGWSEFALRGLSAGLMAAAVAMTVVCVRRLFSARAALIALPFLVLAPFVLRYGYEIRMYALTSLIAVTATWVLVRATQSKKWMWWLLYGTLVALGMYTLYMSAVVWLAHLAWLILETKPLRLKTLLKQRWVGAFIWSVILFLPYIVTFIKQNMTSVLPGVGSEITLEKLADLLSMLTVYRPDWDTGGKWSIVLFVGVIVGGSILARHWHEFPQKTYRYVRLILCLILVPLGFYTIVGLINPVFFVDRYVAHITLFVMVFVSLVIWVGLEHKEYKWTALYSALLVVALISGVQHLYTTGNFNFDRMKHPMTIDVRAAAACDHSPTVVVADDPYTYIDALYYFGDCDFRFFAQTDVEYQGGYAPLRGSDKRVTEQTTFATQRLVHLYWSDQDATYHPPTDYELVQTQQFGHQMVAIYQHR